MCWHLFRLLWNRKWFGYSANTLLNRTIESKKNYKRSIYQIIQLIFVWLAIQFLPPVAFTCVRVMFLSFLYFSYVFSIMLCTLLFIINLVCIINKHLQFDFGWNATNHSIFCSPTSLGAYLTRITLLIQYFFVVI